MLFRVAHIALGFFRRRVRGHLQVVLTFQATRVLLGNPLGRVFRVLVRDRSRQFNGLDVLHVNRDTGTGQGRVFLDGGLNGVLDIAGCGRSSIALRQLLRALIVFLLISVGQGLRVFALVRSG